MENQSHFRIQCTKRVRFRFVVWTTEEQNVMDEELLKCMFLPAEKIFLKITRLLPKKSMRDVTMRMQWLIKHGKCVQRHEKFENIWDHVESSYEGDLSDFSFYIPDNPNDPDHLVIPDKYRPRVIRRSRI
ncbi:uncharacterized protein LOC141705974 [Apium graveolens]|uniref:uncharacterized protein LOC141705974 n=1 Tax=Apium graveolens TaxID=4045 RepID=UPI003D79050F